MRPAQATIDLKALCLNYQLASSLSGSKAIAVIKADAYGHGAVECARALEKETKVFAVAFLEEALELREAGILNPILLLEGFFEECELAQIDQYNLWPVIHSHWQISAIEKAKLLKPLTIFLKMDSGMHRVGFFPEDIPVAYYQLLATKKIANTTLMTHFARADELEIDYTKKQYSAFQEVANKLNLETCVCNSPALLAWPEIRSHWVRPGIMLYGASPFEHPQHSTNQLQPVMTLQSKIISVRTLPQGESIGYGGLYTTNKPSRIGVVAIGYADGYPRHAPNDTPVMVAGEKTRLIGRVSMDMLTVDLTDLPQAGLGSDVELWGKNILASEVALLAQTIPYQLFCNIKRVPRRFTS